MNSLMIKRNSKCAAYICALAVGLLASSVSAQSCCDDDDSGNTATTATNTNIGDNFGAALAVDGDTAVIGAPFNDEEVDNGGRVYVFTFDDINNEWDQQHELVIGAGAGEDDIFGFSVAIDGDVIVAGATGDDDGGSNSGAAYIYVFAAGSWSQVAKITASDAQAQDSFGTSVAISGNWIVVGARDEDAEGGNAGAAYIFEKPTGGWDDEIDTPQKITASDGQAGWVFGFSVDIDGDALIVGSPAADLPNENGAGQAYIFRDNGTTWVEEDILSATTPDELDDFGHAVSISGDGALVGAPYEESGAKTVGAAYVFRFNSSTDEWDDEVRLTGCDAGAGAEYSFSVSLDGDHAAIGARANGFPQDAGSVYTYRNISSGWVDLVKFSAFDGDTFDLLGSAVSISGDKVLIGASGWDDPSGGSEGAVYNFEGVLCPWDLNNDGVVATLDLISLLAQWGTDPGGPPDFNGDGDVSTSDLLALLANWGACACGLTEPLSLEDELDDVCLTLTDWDDFEDALLNGSQAEKDNYLCWMLHYLEDCSRCTCLGPNPSCPDDDPFGG